MDNGVVVETSALALIEAASFFASDFHSSEDRCCGKKDIADSRK